MRGEFDELLTPSQRRLFRDQEEWMKDMGVEFDEERTRLDAIYDLKKRFPTEKSAREAIDMYGGDPVVLGLYKKGVIKKRKSSKNKSKIKIKCKCS